MFDQENTNLPEILTPTRQLSDPTSYHTDLPSDNITFSRTISDQSHYNNRLKKYKYKKSPLFVVHDIFLQNLCKNNTDSKENKHFYRNYLINELGFDTKKVNNLLSSSIDLLEEDSVVKYLLLSNNEEVSDDKLNKKHEDSIKSNLAVNNNSNCLICLDECQKTNCNDVIINCGHYICNECMFQYLVSYITNSNINNNTALLPFTCPVIGCDEILEFDEKTVQKILFQTNNTDNFELFEKWKKIISKLKFFTNIINNNISNFRICPTPDCGQILLGGSSSNPYLKCTVCKFELCYNCNSSYAMCVNCGICKSQEK